MTVQCAWCKKVKVENGWVLKRPRGIITHHICPSCCTLVRREIKEFYQEICEPADDGSMALTGDHELTYPGGEMIK